VKRSALVNPQRQVWVNLRVFWGVGLLFVHGVIVGGFAEWPGLSIATLLLALGYYSFFIDKLYAVLRWVSHLIKRLSFRKNYCSSTTKVCCPSGGNSGLNEHNQSIAQSEVPCTDTGNGIDIRDRLDSQNSIHSQKVQGDTAQHSFGSDTSIGHFLVLLLGIVIGVFMLQPWVMQWGVSHRVWGNALGLGIVLSAVMQLLTAARLVGLKELFALLLGLFCMHALPMLPSVEGAGVWRSMLAGVVGTLTYYLPGISFAFSQAIIGLPMFLRHVASHADIQVIGFCFGTVSALILLTSLFFVMKNKTQGLLRLFLAGLMIATFPLLWPWQQVDDYLLTGNGQAFPLSVTHLSPSAYAVISGEPAHFPSALVCILVGFILTCFTGRQGFKNRE